MRAWIKKYYRTTFVISSTILRTIIQRSWFVVSNIPIFQLLLQCDFVLIRAISECKSMNGAEKGVLCRTRHNP